MIENVTPERCIEFAIRTEEIGAQMYKDLAARFAADQEVRDLFAGLALDEADHGDRFRALLDRFVPRLRDRPVSTDQQDYLRAMSMSEVFDTEALSKKVSGIRNRKDALERVPWSSRRPRSPTIKPCERSSDPTSSWTRSSPSRRSTW